MVALVFLGAMAMASQIDRGRRCDAQVPRAPELAERTPAPVTTLRTRDAEVAIYVIDGALRYTVLGKDARVLMHLGSERAFAGAFPTLAAHVEAAFAEERPWDAAR
jgi:hypothetical protein